MNKIDIVVTEPYIESLRIYDASLDDGIHNVIGSGNQVICLPRKNKFYKAADIESMKLDMANNLLIKIKEQD